MTGIELSEPMVAQLRHKVGEEQLLVGVSPGGLRTLLVLSRPLQVETGVAAPATSFAQRVRDAMQGGTGTA